MPTNTKPGKPHLDHPTFQRVKDAFKDRSFSGAEYRGQPTLIVQPKDLHDVMRFLRDDEGCRYDFLSDIVTVDYLNYPSKTPGRFGLIYILVSIERTDRFFVKAPLEPSRRTDGIEEDPALWIDSVTDIWPGAEWMEREAFDMMGIRFNNHPDLRRILTWKDFPAHPLRKDYPVRGRGEREAYRLIDRTDA